jgi:hypothetical protein
VNIAHSSPVTPDPEPASLTFTGWLASLGLTLAGIGHTPESMQAASDAMDAGLARIRKAAQ